MMGFNVLVVDDSDVIRRMIARTLALAGVPVGEVLEAANGQEALQVLSDSWVDLVLADINMPVMDGAEMLERMRAQPETADVPVIVVSTEGASARVEELMRSGVSAWVRKPFSPEEIRDAVMAITGDWGTGSVDAEVLDEVTSAVIERFAFMFPEPAEEGALVPAEELLFSRVELSGAVAGVVGIVAPSALCAEMAANVLGVDADDPEAASRAGDALGEAANMAAAHVATSIEPEAHTRLHPPVTVTAGEAEWDEVAGAPGTRGYDVEGHRVLVMADVRPPASAS